MAIYDFLMWAGGIIITGLFSLIGWVFTMVFQKIKEVDDGHKLVVKSISDHKLHSAETYATKTDVERGFDRVMLKLDNIDDKLDRKVDK